MYTNVSVNVRVLLDVAEISLLATWMDTDSSTPVKLTRSVVKRIDPYLGAGQLVVEALEVAKQAVHSPRQD